MSTCCTCHNVLTLSQDLHRIGVALAGHRKKILRGAVQLKKAINEVRLSLFLSVFLSALSVYMCVWVFSSLDFAQSQLVFLHCA